MKTLDTYEINILRNLRDGVLLNEADDHLPMVLRDLTYRGLVIWTVNGYRLTGVAQVFLRYGPDLHKLLNGSKNT